MKNVQVRLSQQEKESIREAVDGIVQKFQLEWSEIALFGSRIDPLKMGGDLDLYIQIVSNTPIDVRLLTKELKSKLQDKLGEQKIDLVLDDGKRNLGAFGDIVKQQKVSLWTKK
jgi:hypothetical protein